jgi:putative addiction module component (TIGR02574 family)
MSIGSINKSSAGRAIACAIFISVNLALAIFYFSASEQVFRSSVAPEGSFDGSDVVTLIATAVPYLFSGLVLNFLFAIWAIYSAVRWKVYLRLILFGVVTVLWLGALFGAREIDSHRLTPSVQTTTFPHMSIAQLKELALALPPEERADLADVLWESLDDSVAPISDEFLRELQRRDAEMESGKVIGRTHDEVMVEAKRRLQC